MTEELRQSVATVCKEKKAQGFGYRKLAKKLSKVFWKMAHQTAKMGYGDLLGK